MAKAKNPAVAPVSKAVRFVLSKDARPRQGNALASHTEAFLQLSGMAEGKAVSSKLFKAACGDTAYGYHRRNGNIEETKDGVKLTEQGERHFTNQRIDEAGWNRNIRAEPAMVEQYMAVLSEGKTVELCKNAACIKKL